MFLEEICMQSLQKHSCEDITVCFALCSIACQLVSLQSQLSTHTQPLFVKYFSLLEKLQPPLQPSQYFLQSDVLKLHVFARTATQTAS